MIKKLLTVVVLGASALIFNPASAHNEKPRHGGVVQVAGDLSFELVSTGQGVTIYVEDHGKPMPSAGMTGKLTVLNGQNQSEVDLKPTGDNKLEGQGAALGKGAKAVASITTPKNKTLTVRFAVK